MLPLIFLLGSTASGKGTLGARLAAEFGLYHLSIGDEYRAAKQAARTAIPEMPDEINRYLIDRMEIPPDVLNGVFDRAPFVLQLHNSLMRGQRFDCILFNELLQEKITKVMAGKGDLPRAIVLDGLHALSIEDPDDLGYTLRRITPMFSKLTIHIQCPVNVAKTRYLQRARSRHHSVERFGRRIKTHYQTLPRFLEELQNRGVVVDTVNDDTMTVDEAFRILSEKLDEVPEWNLLIGGSARQGPVENYTS
ncbi:P-loop containing nucleoside triphosphate hydrolase protein [Xylaria digitata]|nr:P-loop containing nucleoside triphosphate hydrolase protein [Xylaria digitata]